MPTVMPSNFEFFDTEGSTDDMDNDSRLGIGELDLFGICHAANDNKMYLLKVSLIYFFNRMSRNL